MSVQVINFAESVQQNQSKNVTIPNLVSVTSATVDTGTVTKSVVGNVVTLNVSGGTPTRSTSSTYTPSEYVTGSIGNSIDSFPSTMTVTKNGITGQIPKSGSSRVISGSAGYTLSKSTSTVYPATLTWRFEWGGSSWHVLDTWVTPATTAYQDGEDYRGTEYYAGWSGPTPIYPSASGSHTVGETTTRTSSGSATYKGTAYKTFPDTRSWQQDYAGTIYGSSQTYYTYYYTYNVTLTYVDGGVVVGHMRVGALDLPLYDVGDAAVTHQLRIKLPTKVVTFNLVPTTDTKASNVRIQTNTGVKSIAKN